MSKKTLALLPVHLKEAALDSPTFRATATHLSEQVEHIERWIESLIKGALRMCHEAYRLDDSVNNFLSRLQLSIASEAVIDHDYSLLAMRRFGEGAKEFWGGIGTMSKRIESILVESLSTFQRTELRSFKESRRTLESAQQKYDSLLQRYAAQSKSKEPSALREDAFQLHEARKVYIKASFDFCIAAPHLRAALDRIITKSMSDMWREQSKIHTHIGDVERRHGNEMVRVRTWSNGMEVSEKAFRQDLLSARREMEEQTKNSSKPARELDEYAKSTTLHPGGKGKDAINPAVAAETGRAASEKYGWLFIRTITGKPARSVWVRKWFYVKEGIFGWFVHGERTGGVEESEKIGVFLCNIKPALQEERRFCFEVKTKDTTLLLQAETQQELSSWIEVFENAKRQALESASTSTTSAFAISPPTAPELAADTHLDDNYPERSLTMPPGTSDSASSMRASVDVTRRGQMFDDSYGGAGHSSRLAQKLDFAHRRSTQHQSSSDGKSNLKPENQSGNATGGMSPSVTGIHALISASHGALPLNAIPQGSGASQKTSDKLSINANAANEPLFQLAPSTLANPPMATNLSKQAIAIGVNSRTDKSVPSGLMANQWGSTNWGHEVNTDDADDNFQNDTHQLAVASKALLASPIMGLDSARHKKAASADLETTSNAQMEEQGEFYPSNYPQELKVHNAQFKILFPRAPKEDNVVLVFRASWNPNNNQEFPCRVFVTTSDIYLYSHFLGLVLVKRVSFDSISEITSKTAAECDTLIFHFRGELKNDDEGDDIIVKIFLDPVAPLQKRLQYLLRTYNSDTPVPTSEVLQRLANIEQDNSSSPETEEWEDLGNEIDHKPDNSKSEKNQMALKKGAEKPFSIQKSLETGISDNAKLEEPRTSYHYEPSGMSENPLERMYDMPAKALFHILFGDKSVVFPAMYQRRRTSSILQGPWSKGDGDIMRREFLYHHSSSSIKHDFKDANVHDDQIIENIQEHLCYVVLDRKKPWHLPYGDYFRMETKIIITAVHKTKCRLTIWTAARWTRSPMILKGITEKRALFDLEIDAKDLGILVDDQARKLGEGVKIKKAVQLFGQVGVLNQSVSLLGGGNESSGNYLPLSPISTRSLPGLIRDNLATFSLKVLTTIILWILSSIRAFGSLLKANHLLLLLLFASLGFNVQFVWSAARSLWEDHLTSRFIQVAGVQPDYLMGRAVYVNDMYEMLRDHHTVKQNSSASPCFVKFCEAVGLDAQIPVADYGTSSRTHGQMPKRLQHSRRRFASYRHDLLVALRVVDSLEKSLLHAEWERWLLEENERCVIATQMLRKPQNFPDGVDMGLKPIAQANTAKLVKSYCSSCEQDLATYHSSDQGFNV